MATTSPFISAAYKIVNYMAQDYGVGYEVDVQQKTVKLGQWHFTDMGPEFHMMLLAQKEVTPGMANPSEPVLVKFNVPLMTWLRALASRGPGHADTRDGVKYQFELVYGREESPGSDNKSSIEL